jgi:hypothetical protein
MNSFFNGLPFGTTQLKMAQTEAAKTESAKSEMAKSEMTQLETAQPEAAKSETAKSEMTQLETAKSEIAQTEIFVEQDAKLGNGTYKEAFTLKQVIPGSKHNFSLPNESYIDKFCLVQFKNFIYWEQEFEFADKEQIDNIAELRKLFDLGNKLFAPKLHQIRIDKVLRDGKIKEYGTPFLPENMDAEFNKQQSSQLVKITYVIEKCDESIIKFLLKNPDKKDEVGQKVAELIEAYVNSESQLMCDIKSENFCPTIINGTFEKVRFLDLDTQFIIDGIGQEFIDNAIVFMKYAFLVHSQRWGEIIEEKRIRFNFGNLGITQEDVDDMILFFYNEEYMKNQKYNPINMLYHYFIHSHPGNFKPEYKVPLGWERKTDATDGKIYYENTMLIGKNKTLKPKQSNYPEDYSFFNYNKLMNEFDMNNIFELIDAYNIGYKIILPARTGKTGGGSSVLEEAGGSKGGKNPRKRRKSKSKKRGRKIRKARTRKN